MEWYLEAMAEENQEEEKRWVHKENTPAKPKWTNKKGDISKEISSHSTWHLSGHT